MLTLMLFMHISRALGLLSVSTTSLTPPVLHYIKIDPIDLSILKMGILVLYGVPPSPALSGPFSSPPLPLKHVTSLSARSRHGKKKSVGKNHGGTKCHYGDFLPLPFCDSRGTDELCSPLTPLRPGSGKFLYALLPLPNVSMMIYGIFYRC
jgi:hypothetical protein